MTIPPVLLNRSAVFPNEGAEDTSFFDMDWAEPVTYLVGRNGSGKTRTAKALADSTTSSLYLSTDRLLGIMSVRETPFGSSLEVTKGVSLGEENREYYLQNSRQQGMALEQFLLMREDPEIALRVAAFVRRALGRTIELRETAGYIDPFIHVGDSAYSLMREEGHGLRELVVLLAALYREDWSVLIVDEPELHLHPALARVWMSEVEAICQSSRRNAVIVTHEPSLVRPMTERDLRSIWYFAQGKSPARLDRAIPNGSLARVVSSLAFNPTLASDLLFSPRPVLVEGAHDLAAFTAALGRSQESTVVAQTVFVPCGSSEAVAMWFSIAKSLQVDALGIVDLDALFSSSIQKLMDQFQGTQKSYQEELMVEPPRTNLALAALIQAADTAHVEKSQKSRSRWLARLDDSAGGMLHRRDKIIEIWRKEGLWVHPKGTLEDVLGIEKGKADPAAAAMRPGLIDEVVAWSSFKLDPAGDLELLLGASIERIASNINQVHRLNADVELSGPTGPSAIADSKLVTLQHLENDRYRLVVRKPVEFKGYWLEFDRATAPRCMVLNPPVPREGD